MVVNVRGHEEGVPPRGLGGEGGIGGCGSSRGGPHENTKPLSSRKLKL